MMRKAARTILTVDDHELVRLGLRSLIRQHFGDRFTVADAHSLEQALLFLKDNAADVFLLLLDLHMSDTRGLAGLQLLHQRYSQLPVIVVSGTNDPRVREEALGHGAIAYFCKTGDAGGLAGLLDTVENLADRSMLRGSSDALRDDKNTAVGKNSPDRNSLVYRTDMKLSRRQIQILELILSGRDNQAIAHETGLTLGSVKNCVSSIFLNFNVRSRAELIGLFFS
jgi:DNA-binding NarL/FixJ family response regulator